MVRTKNKQESIDFLWERSKGNTDCKDNHFFIGKNGEILGHGYLQGNGDYFPNYPKDMKLDITVVKGMNKKDLVEQIRTAMNEE